MKENAKMDQITNKKAAQKYKFQYLRKMIRLKQILAAQLCTKYVKLSRTILA